MTVAIRSARRGGERTVLGAGRDSRAAGRRRSPRRSANAPVEAVEQGDGRRRDDRSPAAAVGDGVSVVCGQAESRQGFCYGDAMSAQMNIWSNVYRHHRWSNRVLIDSLSGLTDGQLEMSVPGTYGSSIATMRHLVSSDADYVRIIPDAPDVRQIDDQGPFGTWDELQAVAWEADSALVEYVDGLTQDAFFIDVDDGTPFDLATSFLLAQIIHHATEHRSHIRTALSAHGIESPEISVWAWRKSEEGQAILDALRSQASSTR